MAYILPQPSDSLLSKAHSFLHRVFAADASAPEQSVVVDSTGKVGIGTTTPGAALHVKGSAIQLQEATTDAGASFQLVRGLDGVARNMISTVGSGTSGKFDLKFGLDSSTWRDIYIGTNNAANGIVLKDGGNVGIGKTTPSQKLDVNGLIKATSVISTGVGTHPTGIGTYVETYVYNNNTGRLFAYDGASYYDFAIGDWNNGNPNIMLKVGGNVGIGVGAPTAKLHLAASTATAGTASLKISAGTPLTTPEAGVVEFDGTDWYFTV